MAYKRKKKGLYTRKKLSPEYLLSKEERAKIMYFAKQRAAKVNKGYVRNRSYSDGSATLFNAIGIAGEICWARYLCVPWYHNPSPVHGDHHRAGDLQDRQGAWIEVKTSRNPRAVRIPPSTGMTWGYLAASWWNPTRKIIRLMGIAPQTMAIAMSVEKETKRKDGTQYTVLQLEAGSLPSCDSIFTNYGRTSHPSGGQGLHCPWCIMGPWYCDQSSCEEAAARRAIEIDDLSKQPITSKEQGGWGASAKQKQEKQDEAMGSK